MNKMLKQERGITLIALIITIIILVILAAVSIRAVTNMGIVGHAVNGSQDYAQAAKDENAMLQNTETKIKDTLDKLSEIQGGTTSGGTTGKTTNPNYSVAVADSDITDPTIFNAEPINTETGALNLATLPTKKAKITGIKSEYLKDGNFYVDGNNKLTTFSSTGAQSTTLSTLVIPDVITIDNVEYAVTEVNLGCIIYDEEYDRNYFKALPNVQTIIFPNTVTKIYAEVEGNYEYEFSFGSSLNEPSSLNPLQRVVFSSNLTEIGDYLFVGTSLTSVEIPSTVTTIGRGAFGACKNLTSVTYNGTSLEIGQSAFQATGLTNASFTTSGTMRIGEFAFCNISNLNKLSFSVGTSMSCEGNTFSANSYSESHKSNIAEFYLTGQYTSDWGKYSQLKGEVDGCWTAQTRVIWSDGTVYVQEENTGEGE